MLTSKQINKIYEDRQRKVKELFKYLRKSSNIGLNSEGFLFCISQYDLYFNRTEHHFTVKNLKQLDSLPERKAKSLPRTFDLQFLDRSPVSVNTRLVFNGYIINRKYYMLYCESITSPEYFSYFWLYDCEFYTSVVYDIESFGSYARGSTAVKCRLGNLYSFDKAMELIETAKNEWILQRL